MFNAVNDTAGPEEQQGFEEGMGQQVEQRGHVGPHPNGGHHITELGDGRIGQDPFDIPLGYRDCGREESGKSPDKGHELQGPA